VYYLDFTMRYPMRLNAWLVPFRDARHKMPRKCQITTLSSTTKGLIIWSLSSRRLVVATTTKPNLSHLASALEVAEGHTIPF
jgi:hypothetical protein